MRRTALASSRSAVDDPDGLPTATVRLYQFSSLGGQLKYHERRDALQRRQDEQESHGCCNCSAGCEAV